MNIQTYRELTEDQFFARFTPAPNQFNPDSGFDGCMFETFGEELAYVQAHDCNLVWTVVECDGQLSIASGFHFVNRIGYLIARTPVDPGHTYNVTCDDLA